MQAIETIELTSTQSSITFTSIPDTFTDLCIKLSVRSDEGSASYDPLLFRYNGSTSGYSARYLGAVVGSFTQSGTNTTATSADATGTWGRTAAPGIPTSAHTANTFANVSIYIANYASSSNKSYSMDLVGENNGTQNSLAIAAGLWNDTDAINEISFALKDGSFVQYSSATLYGILAGDDGTTTVS